MGMSEQYKARIDSALYDDDKWVRRAAVEEIDDKETLKHVALHDKDRAVRLAAVNKIEDQEVLEHIAAYDDDALVRELAVKKIDNIEVLRHIAQHDRSPMVRKAAVNIFPANMSMLFQTMALRDNDNRVRLAAVKRLRDREADIVTDDSHAGDSVASITKQQDGSLLMEILLQSKDRDVRLAAMEMIKDTDLFKKDRKTLLHIAMYDSDEEVRAAARERIDKDLLMTDAEHLKKLADEGNEDAQAMLEALRESGLL